MIASWMAYLGLVAVLAFAAGMLVDRLALMAGGPRRWTWLATLTLSVGVPPFILISFGDSVEQATAPRPAITQTITRLEASLPSSAAPRSSTGLPFDRALAVVWIGGTLAMALWTAAGAMRTRRRLRRCTLQMLDGVGVRRSTDVGPAVVGIVRPEIVVPAWVDELSRAERFLLLRHEQAHIEARDGLLLLLSDAAVTLMPWNPGLWLQRARLRRAVELDCDARVTTRLGNQARYARLLLGVGERLVAGNAGALGLARQRSDLHARIDGLLSDRPPRSVGRVAGLVTAIVLTITLGCAWPRPTPFEIDRPQDSTRGRAATTSTFEQDRANPIFVARPIKHRYFSAVAPSRFFEWTALAVVVPRARVTEISLIDRTPSP